MASSVVDFQSAQDELIDNEVQEVYETVIQTCNKILNHADTLGFEFMHKPDPDVHQMSWLLETVILPTIDKLVLQGDFSPESGIKVANIRQYTLHIRQMTHALNSQNKVEFERIVTILNSEAMLV